MMSSSLVRPGSSSPRIGFRSRIGLRSFAIVCLLAPPTARCAPWGPVAAESSRSPASAIPVTKGRVYDRRVASRPDVSIITVNWNAGEMTARALASIYEHTRDVTFELIAVDNGSTRDDSAAALPARFPSITFIANRTNLGFSAANNQAVARAAGRYVLLLNNDTLQTEDAISAPVRYMDAHPDVGALGIEHRNADATRSVQGSASTFPQPWRELRALLGLAPS